MSWVYYQRSGKLYLNDSPIAAGYSGFGAGKNNPSAQEQVGVGPIPCGAYVIGDALAEDPPHGPLVMRLSPYPETQTFGRSGFLVHGDSVESPGAASHGCIILPRPVRERIAGWPDRLLMVLSGNY